MIDEAGEVFLRACARRGVDFSRTLMLGRQQLPDLTFAEPFFRGLGATSVDSIDASTFEGATIVADLNKPLAQNLRRRFSVVIDGGTLEHVFDVATALRSCLDVVELGGHYIALSPANNWAGHGFYQFSPELFFRALSAEAGYQVRAAFVAELRRRLRWYAIQDPAVLGARLYWRNSFRTYIVMAARRVEVVELSSFAPQQSDYAMRWGDAHGLPANGPPRGATRRVRSALRKLSPAPLQEVYRVAQRGRQERFLPPGFTRVSADRLADHIR